MIIVDSCGYMKQSPVIPVDEILALAAADLALQEKLAMADAIVLATAHLNDCTVITSDADLKNQSCGSIRDFRCHAAQLFQRNSPCL